MNPRVIVLIVCALGATACGTTGRPEPGALPSEPATTVIRVEEVDTGPAELRPDVQLDDTEADGGGVYTALWGRPDIGPASQGFPRTACLPMSIDNHDPRPLTIRAEFEPKRGGRVPVPSAACGDATSMPTHLGPGESATGSLGFAIPSGRGRVILIGSHNFDWYVDIPE